MYHIPIEKHYQNLAITKLEVLDILVAMRIFERYWFPANNPGKV